MIALGPLGDRAFLARFATEAEAGAWAEAVRRYGGEGIVDVVLAYHTVAVFADPERMDLRELERNLRSLVPGSRQDLTGSLITLPVLYDGEDLPAVAWRVGLTVEEVIALHSGRDYHVFAIGFQPGFPYAGYLPEKLSGLERRERPRLRVPAGSVAIAGRQTGVYPAESPGGWHLLGRTPLQIVDLEHAHFPIRAGDRLRFAPIGEQEFAARRGEWLRAPPGGF
jgi:KipI family sensor histidine kinase inhibitor